MRCLREDILVAHADVQFTRPTGWKESLSDSEAQSDSMARARAARTGNPIVVNDMYGDTGCDHEYWVFSLSFVVLRPKGSDKSLGECSTCGTSRDGDFILGLPSAWKNSTPHHAS